MVFVTLGTQKQQFTRLLKILEKSEQLKNEEIIVQAGHTKFESNHMKILDFISLEEMQKYINEAEYIITHGGVGSIIDSLNMGKKVIAAPRLKEYVEHVDNHQLEICEKLNEEGYIEVLNESDDIDNIIEKLKQTEYKKYVSDKLYLEKIENVIEELLK